MITVSIPTYKRPHLLNMALSSLIPESNRISQLMIGVTGEIRDSVNRTTCQILRAFEIAGVSCDIVSGFLGLIDAKEWFIRESTNEVILLLDDDAVVGSGYLDLQYHFQHANISAVSGCLVTPINDRGYSEWSDLPQEFSGSEANILSFNASASTLTFEKKYQVFLHKESRLFRCQFLIGTALFVRRSEVVLDRSFQRGCSAGEEIDFTYAMYKRGRTLIFDSSRVAWHMAGNVGGLQEARTVNSCDLDNYQYLAAKWGFGDIVGIDHPIYNEVPKCQK